MKAKILGRELKTSFNPLNPCDYLRLAGTAPSRARKIYYSPYAEESAKANAERDKESMQRKININEHRADALYYRLQGKASGKKLQQVKKTGRIPGNKLAPLQPSNYSTAANTAAAHIAAMSG